MNVIVNAMTREGFVVEAPGRVNLIGEHIDYHGLPVLPIALQRRVRVNFQPRADRRIHAVSPPYGAREFEWAADLAPIEHGDWENYLRAAARVARTFLPDDRVGIDAEITSDLPAAAGLSSSSALIVAMTLALLRANGRRPAFEELMDVLPDGEQFVGTRGGGMDHAASLASRAGCASLIGFNPVTIRHIPIPAGWGFLVANSMVRAEKSGAAREEYNARRNATMTAREKIATGEPLTDLEREAYRHVTTEAQRVAGAVVAMERDDAAAFGKLLLESHESLRDRLRVSCPALDRLVEASIQSGASGARLTGAGFGGCAVVFAKRADLDKVREALIEKFYGGDDAHVFEAVAGDGALTAATLSECPAPTVAAPKREFSI
jgi:galactokinase